MGHSAYDPAFAERRPWNAGKKLGAKRALKPQQVWAIRFWLEREGRPAAKFGHAPSWSSRRRSGRCSSNASIRRAPPSSLGWNAEEAAR
jgi:hypothetical protein